MGKNKIIGLKFKVNFLIKQSGVYRCSSVVNSNEKLRLRLLILKDKFHLIHVYTTEVLTVNAHIYI